MRIPLILVNALKLHEGPHHLPAGNCQHVLHLAAELARFEQFDIRFITDLQSYGPLAECIDPSKLVYTPLSGPSIIKANRAVVHAVRQLRPDIYHRPTGQLPFLKMPCMTVMGVADLGFTVLPYPPIKRLYKELSYRWSIRQADRVICVSRFTYDDVANRLKVAKQKLRVILHGSNTLPAPEFGLAESLRGPFFIVFAHQPHKNAELCLEAMSELRSVMPTLRLAIIGNNRYIERELKPLAIRLNIGSAAHFVGTPTPSELAGLYHQAVGLLFPSRFEGFGLPVLEAMKIGCPVICSNTCSLPEIAGNAALQLAPDDLFGMKSAMHCLVHDPGWRKEHIIAGRKQAALFTWRHAAEETIAVYQELLSSSNRWQDN